MRPSHTAVLAAIGIFAVVFYFALPGGRLNDQTRPSPIKGNRKPSAPARSVEPPGIDKAKFKVDLSKKYDLCTVGAGLSGAIFAERFANVLGKSALVLDSRHHIGGNCYDFVDQSTGILMNKYGAHLFRTNDERAWRYITMHKNAPQWVRYQHEVRGWIGKRLLPIPVNAYTVNALFNLSIQTEEEMNEWLTKVQIPCPKSGCQTAEQLIKSRVGEQLYKAIFYDYTVKQWNKEPGELKPAAAARIPVYSSFDPRYFTAKYQVLPSKGYTAWFAALLSHPNIDVVLKTNFFKYRTHLEKACGLIVYTGPIDSYFGDSGLDKLEYRSIEFVEKRYFDVGYVQAASVVNYPSKDVKFTRTVEYKHFLNQEHTAHSITVSERSTDKGDPYYPVPSRNNLQLYGKYKKLATAAEASGSVMFVGRLANYKYFSMDEAIVNAVELFYNASKKLGFTSQLGDFSSWMKAPPKLSPKVAQKPPPKAEPIEAPAEIEKRANSKEVLAVKGAACPAPKWRDMFEKNGIRWTASQTAGVCYGIRPGVVHSPLGRARSTAFDETKMSLAKVAIVIRGHFRMTDHNSQAVDHLQAMLKFFPNAKVFLQTWTVRQTSNSWRQGSLHQDPHKVTKEIVTGYYKIPEKNFGGFVLDSEEEAMPKLKGLYTAEELSGMVCSGIHNPSWAPNIGWLQMWWGIVQASQLTMQSDSEFDVLLNLRHDAYKVFPSVIPSWTTLRDLVIQYLKHRHQAATDVTCWIHLLNRPARIGIDTAWVMGARSNYNLAAKWLYDYKAMQEVACRANHFINQEELVPISSVLLL